VYGVPVPALADLTRELSVCRSAGFTHRLGGVSVNVRCKQEPPT